MIVGEVCTREVVFIDRDASILEAARLMRQHHVGDVIVADDRHGEWVPVGILTDRDIVVELLAREVDLNAVSIGDVMSLDLLTAEEDADLTETIKTMRSRGVRRVPVLNRGGGLVGILAADDLIELIAEQLSDVVGLIAAEQKRERAIRD
jgi:CBS domain-containing protein